MHTIVLIYKYPNTLQSNTVLIYCNRYKKNGIKLRDVMIQFINLSDLKRENLLFQDN